MMPKNVLGMIYSNSYDSCLGGLTARRTMGSVPFGGRYRFIDFMLSNLVNCGITKVGLVANSNYHSLMDHVGSGRPWDLSRKTDGLFILPPFDAAATHGDASNRIDVLNRIMDFIVRSKQEYVLLCDSNFICNMDFESVFDFHTAKNADITIVYCEGERPRLENTMVFEVNGDDKITKVSVDPKPCGGVKYSANIILIRKALLERLIGDAESYNYGSFEKDGPLGTTLPRNDTQITTTAGDIILYQGNQITIYYDTNSWNFTRLGKVVSNLRQSSGTASSTISITQAELKKILGKGDVTAVFNIIE